MGAVVSAPSDRAAFQGLISDLGSDAEPLSPVALKKHLDARGISDAARASLESALVNRQAVTVDDIKALLSGVQVNELPTDASHRDRSTLTFMIGNSHKTVKSKKRNGVVHRVRLFVRAPSGHESNIDQILRVRFGLHQTLSVPEKVLTKPPFECTLKLWGYFDVPITIELRSAEPVTFEHTISFDEPLTQRAVEVARAGAARAEAAGNAGIAISSLVDAAKLGEARDVAELAAKATPKEKKEAALHAIIEHKTAVLGVLLGLGPVSGQQGASQRRLWSAMRRAASAIRAQDVGAQALADRAAAEVGEALRSGASWRSQDAVGRQPQHFAAREGLLDVLTVLNQHGGVSEACDAAGMNVLHHAGERGNFKCLEFLVQLSSLDVPGLLVQRASGPFGPGLTPWLLCENSLRSYYPARLRDCAKLFASLTVDFEAVRTVLLREEPGGVGDTVDLLRRRVAGLSALEVDGGRQLRFYEYLVEEIAEGVGIVAWNEERAGLLYDRLVVPIVDAIGREALPELMRPLAKRLLRDVGTGNVDVRLPGRATTLCKAVRECAVAASCVIRSSLEQSQAGLEMLPTLTASVKEVRSSGPEEWAKENGSPPHLQHCHESLEWVRPHAEHELSDVAAVFRTLAAHDVVETARDYLLWVDHDVLPSIGWEETSSADNCAAGVGVDALREGTRGAAKNSMVVLRTLGAAMRLRAYEQLLVLWGTKADATFQARFRNWLSNEVDAFPTGVVGLKPGPVKAVDRVCAKKYDYVLRVKGDEGSSLGTTDKLRSPSEILCAASSMPPPIEEANCRAAGRVCDISRLAVEFAEERALVVVFERLCESTLQVDGMQVLTVKNTHHASFSSESGYRDIKALVLARSSEGGPMFIHEVQLLLSRWLTAKRSMHMLYAVTR